MQQADLSFAFDDAENLQAVAMTDGQMQETQGAVAPLVAYGICMGVMGTIGAVANTWSHYSKQYWQVVLECRWTWFYCWCSWWRCCQIPRASGLVNHDDDKRSFKVFMYYVSNQFYPIWLFTPV